MTESVLATDGTRLKQIDLAESVFDTKVSEGAIFHAIRNELANARTGTASAKNRGAVRGTSRKPWKQKGTGRARAGDRKSPLWVGGGQAFGPSPRDYRYSIPRKAKRSAMRSILTLRLREGQLKIVEDFTVESGKTRDLVGILRNLVPNERTVIILHADDRMIKRAGRNVPWLKMLKFDRLRAHDLFYGRHLLVFEGAALKLNEFYAGTEAHK